MKVAAIFHTESYRGDHSADVSEVIELAESETVQQLAERCLNNKDRAYCTPTFDWIEIKKVKELPKQ